MLSAIEDYIKEHQLLTAAKPVIVGLSGGADSIALLHILVRLGYTCIAAHCNFHLRAGESDRDELFCKEMTESLLIPFFKKDFDTPHYAKENGVSIEMAARDLRYSWFNELLIHEKAQAVAVAHHSNDNAETVIMNLIRGTGIKGLRGIRPKSGNVVRPLLAISREDITNWLQYERIPFVTDSTNLSSDYTRNYIRNGIIPSMQKINPSVSDAINRTAEHINDVDIVYRNTLNLTIEKAVRNNTISIKEIVDFPVPELLLFEILHPYGFNRFVIRDILLAIDKKPGKLFYSPTHKLLKDRNHFILSLKEDKNRHLYTIPEGTPFISDPIKLFFERIVLDEEFLLLKDKHIACFDYNKLSFPLTLRTWRQGDRFIPFGMQGSKKISDYFADKKYNRSQKDSQWLLCSGNDIIWVVGERSDNRFRIGDDTQEVLIVKFSV